MLRIVYRLDWFSRIAGKRVEWFISVAQARARVIALLADEPYIVGVPEVSEVDFPAAPRTALVEWLNKNVRSGNA